MVRAIVPNAEPPASEAAQLQQVPTASSGGSGANKASSSGVADTSIAGEILALHNSYRARDVDTPPLTWNSDLEATAASWAQRCLYQVQGLKTRMPACSCILYL